MSPAPERRREPGTAGRQDGAPARADGAPARTDGLARPDGVVRADGVSRADGGPARDIGPTPWPPDVSHEPSMSIGAVLGVLKPEFPAVTISKLRFLEEQGLVSPRRTGSGYRKYSRADVERIRYALTAQRDAYLPLRVIREQLADLDAGHAVTPPSRARVVTRDGELVAPPSGARVSAAEISELTGATEAELDELALAGLITADSRGRFPGRAVQVVQAALALGRHGISARHLRTVRTSAERQADVIDQVVAPLRAQRSGAARERGAARAAELAELYTRLHAELLRGAVEQLG
ncbi:MerR family transcriptional regulator [Georgenia sp. TF02-10]|uniref:transcriptional regulator FtsR n=1 Tax=Georgenia sp. TF02-10 TaxID=2917725 RepID=UPI001FA7530C|nr:MerR family transcriptional regulator [Georgenia sp. TF02-10]UNX53158.1 MerR family transcriptional regulator [Georgenia sp. TF02-10]